MFFSERGFPKFNIFPILNIFQIMSKGEGVIKFPIFPKFKKVQNILGEGGQENCGLFPLFVTFFIWDSPLTLLRVKIPPDIPSQNNSSDCRVFLLTMVNYLVMKEL